MPVFGVTKFSWTNPHFVILVTQPFMSSRLHKQTLGTDCNSLFDKYDLSTLLYLVMYKNVYQRHSLIYFNVQQKQLIGVNSVNPLLGRGQKVKRINDSEWI